MSNATLADRLDGLRVEIIDAIESEPEYPGVMPDEMWDEVRRHKDVAEEAMRLTVKLTKENIRRRVNGILARAIVAKADEAQDFSLTVTKHVFPYTGNGVMVRVTHNPTGKYADVGFSGMGFDQDVDRISRRCPFCGYETLHKDTPPDGVDQADTMHCGKCGLWSAPISDKQENPNPVEGKE